MFKSDYTLQLKEASAGSFMGTAAASQGLESEGFRRVSEKRPCLWSSEARRAVLVVMAERLSHELMLNMGGDA